MGHKKIHSNGEAHGFFVHTNCHFWTWPPSFLFTSLLLTRKHIEGQDSCSVHAHRIISEFQNPDSSSGKFNVGKLTKIASMCTPHEIARRHLLLDQMPSLM